MQIPCITIVQYTQLSLGNNASKPQKLTAENINGKLTRSETCGRERSTGCRGVCSHDKIVKKNKTVPLGRAGN